MRSYSERAIAFMGTFLSRYARDWKIDFASFRPIEEEGRKVSLRSTQRPHPRRLVPRRVLRTAIVCSGYSPTSIPSGPASG